VQLSSWEAGTAATGSYQLLFNLAEDLFLTQFYTPCGLDSHAVKIKQQNDL
jgi:hypothetical protein